MKNEMSLNKRYWIVFLSSLLAGGATIIPLSYVSYIYTDVAGINYPLMSLGLTIVSIIGLVVSLFSGMLIQKTKTKQGQYRPWFIVCYLSIIVGVYLMLIKTGNIMATFIMVTVGYLICNLGLDIGATAQYGIYEKMSLGESNARDKLYAGWSAGINLGYTIISAVLLTLVAFFGGDDMGKGFLGAETVIAVLTIVGVLMLYIGSKNFDTDNRHVANEEEMPPVSVKDMLNAVAGNMPIIALSIGELFKYTGYYLFNLFMVYHCTYVLGSINMMTIALTSMSIAGVIASFVTPTVIKICKGRKNTLKVVISIAVVSYVVMGFTGGTATGFFIPFIIASFVEGIYLATSINCYLDTGEYWYDKTGNDTRAYIMSIQAIIGKIGMLISSPLLAVAMAVCSFSEGVGIATAEGVTMMTRLTGFMPAIGAAVFLITISLLHKVSDKEMEACIARNAEKDANLYGDMK